MLRTRRIASVAGLASAALIAGAPSGALAANTFVDATRPNDNGSCLTPAEACETIAGGIAKAGIANTVFVVDPAAPTTYSESVVLDSGKSLRALSLDPTETIIDNGDGGGTTPAILVAPSGGGGTIRGFTIRSDHQAILAQDQISVAVNRFDESATLSSASRANVQLNPGASGSSVTGNVFEDPTPLDTELQRGVHLLATGAAAVTGNSLSGFSEAISVGGPFPIPLISGNQISGAHPDADSGAGIHVFTGDPTLIANTISNPALDGDVVEGVVVDATAARATLKRNLITGHTTGVVVNDAHDVSLNSDLIARSVVRGLLAIDSGADELGPGDVGVTNATIVESGAPGAGEIQLAQTELTLNSTIVGNRGIGGTGTCLISHSRGPTTSGAPCRAFQTSAAPGFVSPGSNYHLASGSAMIDAGDPAPPPFGELDFDAQPRALDAILPCGVRRDIGADEFGARLDCESPDTSVRGPSKVRTRKKRARLSFTLAATEFGSFFQCSVDDAAFVVCSSPFTVKLRQGKHSLTVRAVDLSANPDTSPARLGITVARKKKKRRRSR